MYTTFDGTPTSLELFLNRHLNGSRVVYIGTDSKTHHQTNFSTVLVAYHPGRGGVILRRSRHEDKIDSLQERLWKEAWYSVQLALDVMERISDGIAIEIHLDINSDARHRSGLYQQSLVGLVTSQGFACRVKPDAWCATSIADRLVRAL